jgi:ABC-2 type transport system permease protein
MIHRVMAITHKELKVLFRDREALALLFAIPIFFILVMSFALEGVYEAGSKGHPIEILVVHPNGDPLADQTVADLKRMEGLILIETHEGAPLTPERVEKLIGKGIYPLALFFPENYTEQISKQAEDPLLGRVTVHLISDPAMNLQLLATVKGAIESVIEHRVLLATLPKPFQKMFGSLPAERAPRSENQNVSEWKKSRVDLVHTFPKSYQLTRRPTATEQNVPGYTIFGIFFIVLTLASSFLQEKKDGTFQRILAAPLTKTTLLIGKLLPYYLVNLVQIGLMFCIGVVLFGMKIGNFPALIIVSLALAATANGLGLLVAALGKTEAQVNGLSVLLAITLSALGGMMVPTFIMPNLMKTLSLFTPHAWALTGYHDIIIRGLGVRDILKETFVLLGFAFSFFLIALWRFRFHH